MARIFTYCFRCKCMDDKDGLHYVQVCDRCLEELKDADPNEYQEGSGEGKAGE